MLFLNHEALKLLEERCTTDHLERITNRSVSLLLSHAHCLGSYIHRKNVRLLTPTPRPMAMVWASGGQMNEILRRLTRMQSAMWSAGTERTQQTLHLPTSNYCSGSTPSFPPPLCS